MITTRGNSASPCNHALHAHADARYPTEANQAWPWPGYGLAALTTAPAAGQPRATVPCRLPLPYPLLMLPYTLLPSLLRTAALWLLQLHLSTAHMG